MDVIAQSAKSPHPQHLIQEPLDQFRKLEDYLQLQVTRLAEIFDRLEGRDAANMAQVASPPPTATEAFPPGLVGAFKRSHANSREHADKINNLISAIAEIV